MREPRRLKDGVDSKRGDFWSKEDIALLKRERGGDKTSAEIGQMCNPRRTAEAVLKQVKKLKLPPIVRPKGKRPPTPRAMLKPTEPRKLDSSWNIWTHWEPGLPSHWEHKTTEMPSFRCCLDAVMCWHCDAA